MKYYIGVDIGGTRVKLGLINEQGEVIDSKNVPTKQEKLELFSIIKEFVSKQTCSIQGVGLSTPGIITEDGYMQTSGAIKCFFKQYIKDELEEYLDLPVVIENDGHCAALAEKWIGAAVNENDFVCMTLGTAIGGAIFIDGTLRRGLGGLAGEFGVSLAGLEKDVYDEQSFAYHAATVGGLCRQYSYAIKEPVLDAREILKRAKNGDKIAEEKVQDFYYSVATLCINVATTIAPKTIFLGGGISANEEVMNQISSLYQKICNEYHVLSLLKMPQLKTCKLKNDAGMIGAVYAFITRS